VLVTASIIAAWQYQIQPELALLVGLLFFGIVFAINSAVHSYLIVAWSEHDKVSMNVGFYYMSNAGGRLTGTILSGWVFQNYGLIGCLAVSAVFILIAAILSMKLPIMTGSKTSAGI